jgi:hypothetical protein
MSNGSNLKRGVDRLKLVAIVLEARVANGGAFLVVSALIRGGCLLAAFPWSWRSSGSVSSRRQTWSRRQPWRRKTDLFKDYFGEKIGLYFL